MREVVFRVLAERPGHVEAAAADPVLRIAAPSLEELHHEAREALIQALGAAHCAYRVRIRRNLPSLLSAVPPLPAPPALCG